MRHSSYRVKAAFLGAFLILTGTAKAGVAVVVDRDELPLVANATDECPRDRVIFVTDGAKVRAMCDAPQKSAQPGASLQTTSAAQASSAATAMSLSVPPAPTWVALAGAPVQATLRTWLPKDWTLKWDTTADPRGIAASANGDFLEAVRALFATRRAWTESAQPGQPAPLLEVRVFAKERILQVRDQPVQPSAVPAPPAAVSTPAVAAANASSQQTKDGAR